MIRGPRWGGRRLLPCVIAAVLAAPLSALAERAAPAAASAERGRELYLEADFEAARAAFEALLAGADLDREGAVEAHRHLAAIALIVGDADGARRHLRVALALAPSAGSPEGAPPELDALLEEERAGLGGEAAALEIGAEPPRLAAGREAAVTVRLRPAPPGLADALALRCSGEGMDDLAAEGPPPSLTLVLTPAAETDVVRCSGEAATSAGAVLVESSAELPVGGGGSGGSGGAAPWWPWAVGAAGVAIVAGVVTAIVVTTAGPDDAILRGPRVEGW